MTTWTAMCVGLLASVLALPTTTLAGGDDPAAKPCAAAKECVAQLQRLGAVPASPADGSARGLASRAVFLGGKASLAPLARLVSAKNESVARAAAVALGAAGSEAAASFPLLAHALDVERGTTEGGYNRELPRALADIDLKRAVPRLQAASQKGNVFAARVLLERAPESFRAILVSTNPAAAIKLLLDDAGLGVLGPLVDRDTRRPFLELAAQNPKLPAPLKQQIESILAARTATAEQVPPSSPDAGVDAPASTQPANDGELPWLALLQAVLDDAGFATRVQSRGAALPLHVSFELAPAAGTERLRFGGEPVVVDTDRRAIAAGRTLEVHRPSRAPGAADPNAVAILALAYPALQIDEVLRLIQEGETWKLVAPVAPPIAATVPPPPDVKRRPADATTTASGLAHKLVEPAALELYDTQTPQGGTVVTVDITAWTSDGQLYFPTRGKAPARVQLPLSLTLGGLGEGIALMRLSEAWRFWIPARLAFAAPAGQQDLVVDVRLVDVIDEESEDPFLSTAEEIDEVRRPPSDLTRPPVAAQTLPSGLVFHLLKQGKARTGAGDGGEVAAFSYKAWSRDGTLFAHASLGRANYRGGVDLGAPLSLLIPGLADALRRMTPGNRYRVWIPASLAYGKEPRALEVPAGPLVIDVELAGR